MKTTTKNGSGNLKNDWRYLTTVPALVWVFADKFEALLEKYGKNRGERG